MLLLDGDLYFTYEVDIKKCKLVLHPLSDLTKEIEVNGEKFVPLHELAKVADIDTSDEAPVFHTYNGVHGARYNIENDDDDYTHEVFAYDNYNNFGRHKRRGGSDFNGDIFHCPNQLELFQKMYEWHFNVLNLPEHLWIDINTL
jgi:hypothetical protein